MSTSDFPRMWGGFNIPLWFGFIRVKSKGLTLYSERSGSVPTFTIGPIRVTWRRYRYQ